LLTGSTRCSAWEEPFHAKALRRQGAKGKRIWKSGKQEKEEDRINKMFSMGGTVSRKGAKTPRSKGETNLEVRKAGKGGGQDQLDVQDGIPHLKN
jgi:hypothetical protein